MDVNSQLSHRTFTPGGGAGAGGASMAAAAAAASVTTTIEEAAAQILLHALRTSRSVQPFNSLDSWDQVSLLQECWNELFLLHAAYWPGVDFCALLSHSNLRIEEGSSSEVTVRLCFVLFLCLLFNHVCLK